MVRVAADEGTTGECAERSTLVLAALLGKERRVEDASVVLVLHNLADAQAALRCNCEVVVDLLYGV